MTQITPKKTSIVQQLSDLYSRSKSVAVVDYKGLKVSQATQLRREVKKSGGEMVVTKNTLFKIAANQKDLKLEGTSAFIFSLTDEIATVKTLADFAKKNGLPTFKLGFMSDKVLTASDLANLATLPDKPTLIAKTVGMFNSPLFRLAYSLNWNLSKLVRTLDAVRQKKS